MFSLDSCVSAALLQGNLIGSQTQDKLSILPFGHSSCFGGKEPHTPFLPPTSCLLLFSPPQLHHEASIINLLETVFFHKVSSMFSSL